MRVLCVCLCMCVFCVSNFDDNFNLLPNTCTSHKVRMPLFLSRTVR